MNGGGRGAYPGESTMGEAGAASVKCVHRSADCTVIEMEPRKRMALDGDERARRGESCRLASPPTVRAFCLLDARYWAAYA